MMIREGRWIMARKSSYICTLEEYTLSLARACTNSKPGVEPKYRRQSLSLQTSLHPRAVQRLISGIHGNGRLGRMLALDRARGSWSGLCDNQICSFEGYVYQELGQL